MDESKYKYLHPGYALAIGLALAAIIWLLWLSWGMEAVRSQVAKKAVQPGFVDVSQVQPNRTLNATVVEAAGQQSQREKHFAELGQSGDSFGGLNALLTALAGALVAWAGYMQHLALKHAKREAEEERLIRQRQEFESQFFRLLELCERVSDRIEGPPRRGAQAPILPGMSPRYERLPGRLGARGLDSFARLIFDADKSQLQSPVNLEALEHLIKLYLKKVYHERPSALGPYYRLLYQTFRHVAESQLPDEMMIRYANIARGQISDGAVLLLALNGLTSRGYKFIPLIEQFGLLEHLHRSYRGRYLEQLKLGYRERAFMGSEDRKRLGNEFDPVPMLKADMFAHLESALDDADEESGFMQGYIDSSDDEVS